MGPTSNKIDNHKIGKTNKIQLINKLIKKCYKTPSWLVESRGNEIHHVFPSRTVLPILPTMLCLRAPLANGSFHHSVLTSAAGDWFYLLLSDNTTAPSPLPPGDSPVRVTTLHTNSSFSLTRSVETPANALSYAHYTSTSHCIWVFCALASVKYLYQSVCFAVWVQYSLCVHIVTSRSTGDGECCLFVPLCEGVLLWGFSPRFFKPRTSSRKWEKEVQAGSYEQSK